MKDLEDPETRDENSYCIGKEPQGERVRKAQSISPTPLKPPMKTTESNSQKDPQERSKTLERLTRSGMANKPENENIQGVGLRTL